MFNINTDHNFVDISADGQRLLESNGITLMMPEFKELKLNPVLDSLKEDGNNKSISFSADGVKELSLELTLLPELDAIDIQCSFRTAQDMTLNRLNVFPIGTKINMYNCINFRNRHATEKTWPELLLGNSGFSTSTYSDDWQFAPHPTMIGFTKLDSSLFIAALDLPQAFGLHVKVSKYQVDEFYLDYGENKNGLLIKGGETFTSPAFRIFAREGLDPYQMYTEFGKMLIDEKRIPNPKKKKREAWWQAPLYCTWIDQTFTAEVDPPHELNEQTAEAAHPTRAVFNEKMVRDAVEIIKGEKFPFKTILLDEGWHVGRGHWVPHEERFPDLRKLVDDLHADGFKVVVWWNWCEIEKSVEEFVNKEHLISNGKRNKHECLMRDYSSKKTQEEYLKPLFHKLFSSDEGCYNLDGVKTDFQADKVHADMPPADPAWRGEEMTFYQMYKLFYNEMKKHKSDAVHIGGAGNYWLAEFIDINRTYDVFTSNYLEHEERAKMLYATTPGCPVVYDFHDYLENLDGYFESAKKLGASVQIGNLLKVKQDYLSSPEPATDAYYAILKKHLG